MKQPKSALVLVGVLVMALIWGFIVLERTGYIPGQLDIVIFALIMISGIYAFVVHMRRHKDIERGLPVDDELSTSVKYKAGYYAFMASLFVWVAILLLQRHFPDVDTMLGSGILASCILAIFFRVVLGRSSP